MNTEKHFNLAQCVSVRIRGERLAKEVVWQEAVKKTFWNSGQKEGFYCPYVFSVHSAEDLASGNITEWSYTDRKIHGVRFIIKGKEAFYYPDVTVKFSNGESFCREFDTYEQALQYAKSITDNMLKIVTIYPNQSN